ncbi:uncharacterized protein At4g00950-like [Chenopodium quinoa]|uniref:Uncharacterized protein n=1 Tax=Chenopodium quinoa TaxID=63459 RepID=A0A803KZP7_CHEQI|nr:uncharacterized protein At4g00950-like [Chenopodium quinoa]
MEFEEAETNTTIPKLPLYSLKNQQQRYSGNLTSPLHTSASVPFKWEEHPGKPLPCLTLALPSTVTNTVKSLELPPRLLNESKFTKTPSPTTVLEGPYSNFTSAVGKSSSFRFLRKRQGSFDGTFSLWGSRGSSPERGLLGTIVLSRSGSSRRENKGLFGSWKKKDFKSSNNNSKTSEVVDEGNFVFPTLVSVDDGATSTCTGCDGNGNGEGGGTFVKVSKMNSKKTNFLGLSQNKSHFWAAIYGAFKQVIPSPRRSTKWKKDAW